MRRWVVRRAALILYQYFARGVGAYHFSRRAAILGTDDVQTFCCFLIRLQALWLFFNAVIDASYLTDYLMPGVRFTPHAKMIVVRVVLHVALGIICLRYADRIISWFVKDILPKGAKSPAT